MVRWSGALGLVDVLMFSWAAGAEGFGCGGDQGSAPDPSAPAAPAAGAATRWELENPDIVAKMARASEAAPRRSSQLGYVPDLRTDAGGGMANFNSHVSFFVNRGMTYHIHVDYEGATAAEGGPYQIFVDVHQTSLPIPKLRPWVITPVSFVPPIP